MAESRLSVRVNADTKQQAEAVFEQLGLSLSAGVNVYLTRVAKLQKIPFDLSVDDHRTKDETDIIASMKAMELDAQTAVDSEIAKLKSNEIPIALYDAKKKKANLI